jgi:hypothetical protein
MALCERERKIKNLANEILHNNFISVSSRVCLNLFGDFFFSQFTPKKKIMILKFIGGNQCNCLLHLKHEVKGLNSLEGSPFNKIIELNGAASGIFKFTDHMHDVNVCAKKVKVSYLSLSRHFLSRCDFRTRWSHT